MKKLTPSLRPLIWPPERKPLICTLYPICPNTTSQTKIPANNVTLLWENPGLETPYFPLHRGKLVAEMTNPRAIRSPAVFLVTA